MKRLRKVRKARGITMKTLGEIVGVSESTISNYELGVREPDFATATRIADFFDCSVDYLIGRTTSTNGVLIPILGKVVAGIPIDAIEEILGYEEITKDLASSGDFFALKVTGNSMSPALCEGDVVIVKKTHECSNGSIAVVLVGDSKATLKKIQISPNGIMLVPLNPEYMPMHFSPSDVERLPVNVIGKVIEMRRKFI